MIITIGYVLAGLIAAAIIVIGARFLLAPAAAAEGYGVPGEGAYLSVKGIRDIASGLIVIVLMVAGATHLLSWVLLAATIIPVADAVIVLRSGGTKSVAFGIHGGTAVVMVVTAALLLMS